MDDLVFDEHKVVPKWGQLVPPLGNPLRVVIRKNHSRETPSQASSGPTRPVTVCENDFYSCYKIMILDKGMAHERILVILKLFPL